MMAAGDDPSPFPSALPLKHSLRARSSGRPATSNARAIDTATRLLTSDPRTPTPSPVPADVQRYKGRSGDTLSSIAAKFGVTVKALKRANGITDPSLIRDLVVLPPLDVRGAEDDA